MLCCYITGWKTFTRAVSGCYIYMHDIFCFERRLDHWVDEHLRSCTCCLLDGFCVERMLYCYTTGWKTFTRAVGGCYIYMLDMFCFEKRLYYWVDDIYGAARAVCLMDSVSGGGCVAMLMES